MHTLGDAIATRQTRTVTAKAVDLAASAITVVMQGDSHATTALDL